MKLRSLKRPRNSSAHPATNRDSIALALIHAIEKSSFQISKHIYAEGFGTILITIIMLVMPGLARLMLSSHIWL